MTTKINVLQVIPKLGYGGAETGCYDIAHYLAEKECGSYIATASGELLKFVNSSATPIADTFAAECFIHEEEYLINRVETLAKKHGFQYRILKFKVMKTRWGSCTAKNNINLNMLITYLPKKLQDYVILHELVHTRIKDHSHRFWALLDKITGDAKGIHKELKEKYILIQKL